MKKIFTVLCSILIGTGAFAQMVPNGGFEDGATEWKGNNAQIIDKVTVNLSSGGQEVILPVNGTKMAFLQNTTTVASISQKFAYSQRPNSFRFMYNYLPAGQGEAAAAIVRLTKYNTTTMSVDTLISVAFVFPSASYPWKEAILELSDKYKITGNPDTAYISFITSVSTVRLQGTSMILDNVKFSENSATAKELNNNLVGAPEISPNPVSDKATIRYQINTTSDVKVELYDMSGKMVKEILNEKQNYGTYTAEVDVEGLTPGIYYYKVSTGSYSETNKLIISR
ncbi:MAG: T9SS type A sorting domain-containing protein [Flavobacteriales bacterium]|nr:T9SS type A sorting domain-containing protein [Flavobacteriales bacterium]